jgi:hypothetical protein
MKKWPILLAIFLAGCQTTQPAPPEEPKDLLTPTSLSETQFGIVKASVIERLKDPESARFGKYVAGSSKSGDITVCGFVNAKNSFGGYTGDRPYFGLLFNDKLFVVIGISESDTDVQATMKVCADNGLNL